MMPRRIKVAVGRTVLLEGPLGGEAKGSEIGDYEWELIGAKRVNISRLHSRSMLPRRAGSSLTIYSTAAKAGGKKEIQLTMQKRRVSRRSLSSPSPPPPPSRCCTPSSHLRRRGITRVNVP